MSDLDPTFVFGDDDKVYAYVDGKIVASANDPDELEKKLAGPWDALPPHELDGDPHDPGMPAPQHGEHHGMCPACNGEGAREGYGGCQHCGGTGMDPAGPYGDPAAPGAAVDPLPNASPDTLPGDNLPPRATHVTTPNGIKGQILGKQKGLWGDQVTIRLENGRIAKFDVTGDETYSTEKTAKVALADTLTERLDAEVTGTKDSLVARIKELKAIKVEAVNRISKAKYTEQQQLHNIVVTADMEIHEVTDALAGLEDAEPFIPEAPFSSDRAVEQESLGGGDSTWLDNTVEEMIAEAEGQDFDQLLNEGPESFVAELETPALADGGVVHELADSYVSSKVAGLDRTASAEYKEAFLTRVEEVRRAELTSRKEELRAEATQHEASVNDGPDEGIFW